MLLEVCIIFFFLNRNLNVIYLHSFQVLSKFDNTVVSVIDSSVERPGSSWSSLATLRGETEKSISKIEVNAADAL